MSMRSSTLIVDGASPHRVNKVVKVEHDQTSFYYRSLRSTINKHQPIDDESRHQGTEYIQQV
jgi:hypothetical protein